MQEKQAPHFIGLDIGTSTVRCVVGMLDQETGALSIVGHGSSPSLGMRKGVVVHIDDVVNAITQAATEAERVSGVRVSRATVNINGAHVTGQNSRGVIAISNANREISHDDRFRAEEAATIINFPANREIVQVFAKSYRVDGQENIKDPVGMQGVRLEVETHIVTASSPAMRSLDTVLERAHVEASHHTVSSLAAAEAVLNRQQKESGTLLLDIGAGTTNMVVIEDGEVQHVAVIPMGGMHITNDLAIGLKTDLDIAEQVKIRHAAAGKELKGTVKVTHPSGAQVFSAEEIGIIAEARVDELLDYVDKELKKIQKAQKLPGGVVLVGGTAKLPGIAAFTRDKLQLAARVGKLQNVGGLIDTVDDPAYASAVGLMMLDMLFGAEQPRHAMETKSGGVFNFLTDMVKKFKP